MTRILDLVRKLIGGGETPGPFDSDLLVHINSVLFILTQLGVGPSEGFIADENSKWTDFLPEGMKLELVKSFVYMKVKLIFDPPSSSSALDSMTKLVSELEWRILVAVDPPVVIPVEGGDQVV